MTTSPTPPRTADPVYEQATAEERDFYLRIYGWKTHKPEREEQSCDER
jgi:hypothetical protein